VTHFHPTGSGDTTLDYVQVFCFFFMAFVAAVVWSILDRHRPNYNSLYPWVRLAVRFTLAFTMLSYGFAKVFPLQFGTQPSMLKLTESVGELSPMGILWTMMSASIPYTVFCGLVEVMGGLLLLFRRTLTLGALMSSAALLNIVLLNFCYDVPVKLYSVHLLLMAWFLLIADAKSLWSFFIAHNSSQLQGVWVPFSERRWLRIARVSLQALVIGSVLYGTILSMAKMSKSNNATRGVTAPLEGIWTRDDSAPESTWQAVAFQSDKAQVRLSDRAIVPLKTAFDQEKHSIKIQNLWTGAQGQLTYRQPDDSQLVINGTLDKKPVSVALHKMDIKVFLLTTRGFHWISEDPFNR
jgi:hypothetical protein